MSRFPFRKLLGTPKGGVCICEAIYAPAILLIYVCRFLDVNENTKEENTGRLTTHFEGYEKDQGKVFTNRNRTVHVFLQWS